MNKETDKKLMYEEAFNEILEMDIKWSNLPIEDLGKLAVLFDNPELLYDKIASYRRQIRKRERKTFRRERRQGLLATIIDGAISGASERIEKIVQENKEFDEIPHEEEVEPAEKSEESKDDNEKTNK